MIIDYEIVWVENGKMNFQQFSYEMGDISMPLNSYLPDELYKFYVELLDKKVAIMVFAGEKSTGTGLLKYCGANPVYQKDIIQELKESGIDIETVKMSDEWWDQFKGRCVSCSHSCKTGKLLMCQNGAASEHGLHKSRVGAGGSWNGDAVHPMFGCVFFNSSKIL